MPEREYRLLMQDNTERTLLIPDNWKLTFGPTVPFSPRSQAFQTTPRGWSLRLYEPPKILRGVIGGVREFWDASIRMTVSERDENGMVVAHYSVVPPSGVQESRVRVRRDFPIPTRAPSFRQLEPDPSIEHLFDSVYQQTGRNYEQGSTTISQAQDSERNVGSI